MAIIIAVNREMVEGAGQSPEGVDSSGCLNAPSGSRPVYHREKSFVVRGALSDRLAVWREHS